MLFKELIYQILIHQMLFGVRITKVSLWREIKDIVTL